MLVKLIEIKRDVGGESFLNEIYVNSTHIISVSETHATRESMIKESKELGLVDNITFSDVVVSEGNRTRALTVVGSPTDIHNKIRKRQILRG